MQSGKILLMHRHAGTRSFLKKGLEQRGCEVILGFSGACAENILKLEDVRAAFVDLRALECESMALVHGLRQLRPDLPIFGLAERPSRFEIQACRQARLQGYFTAPYNVTALGNAIERIFRVTPNDHKQAAQAV